MSSPLAIAAVTAALRLMLQAAANETIGGAEVLSGHPREFEGGGSRKTGVNLFLYQVAPNAAWRNSAITIRRRDPADLEDRAKETLERTPIVPLNLYYVISFYGNEREFEPHRLLGGALRAIHNAPRRLPEALARVPDEYPYLADSGLAFQISQIERVRLSPVQLNLEELAKLWSVFFQVPYALSVAYEAAVVLLEVDDRRRTPVVTDPRVQPFAPDGGPWPEGPGLPPRGER